MLFDFDRLSPEDRYKLLVSTVVPRPIAWVVTCDLAGRVNAAPFSFFNAVSGDPPIVVIGIGGRGPGESKDTAVNIRNTPEFVVNLVSAACAEPMNVTAIEFGSEVRELEEAGLTPVPSMKVKPPRIAESPVALECVKHVTVELGTDRSVVFGRVLAVHVRDDAVLDAAKCYIDVPKLDLIGRMHGRGWYAHTRERFEMPRIEVAEWENKKAAD
ncbi:MAG TPA: flavin reductase family protein [Acetobacteraceae bacterium]|jgi:flavin reductase (DIM6/NTAB) family NADH-FMN oxidoreductase RutF|nr:flavin reductase family protein [Acetobacteraceae bacterium]